MTPELGTPQQKETTIPSFDKMDSRMVDSLLHHRLIELTWASDFFHIFPTFTKLGSEFPPQIKHVDNNFYYSTIGKGGTEGFALFRDKEDNQQFGTFHLLLKKEGKITHQIFIQGSTNGKHVEMDVVAPIPEVKELLTSLLVNGIVYNIENRGLSHVSAIEQLAIAEKENKNKTAQIHLRFTNEKYPGDKRKVCSNIHDINMYVLLTDFPKIF